MVAWVQFNASQVHLEPLFAKGWARLALAVGMQGDRKVQLAALQKAISIRPSDASLIQMLREIEDATN